MVTSRIPPWFGLFCAVSAACALPAMAGPAVAAPALNVLFTFATQGEGLQPVAGPVPDSAGNLYVATLAGGDENCTGKTVIFGCGAIVKLSPPHAGGTRWTETVIHAFTSTDGAEPFALVADGAGNLYAATGWGGLASCGYGWGCGTVVELSPPAIGKTAWTETVLYTAQTAGRTPEAMVADGKGNLYITTANGGAFGQGSLTRLSPPAAGQPGWTQTVVFSFRGGAQASGPKALVAGPAGSFYISADGGGATGGGAVVRLSPSKAAGAALAETVLHNFAKDTADSYQLTLSTDRAGNLYETDPYAGLARCRSANPTVPCGTIFKLSPPAKGGSPWIQSVIYRFKGGTDGAFPSAPLIEDAKGNLFTTTIGGGTGQNY